MSLLRLFLLSLFFIASINAAPTSASSVQREAKRREVMSRLDQLNQNQNQVRRRLTQIQQSQLELNMAAENLVLEVQKQKEAEAVSKQRLMLLLKVVYKIHRDGILRFAMSGGDLGQMVKRARVLYRTLRANSGIAQQMQARSLRLAESEKKLETSQKNMNRLLDELREQEGLLGTFLEQKKRVLGQLAAEPVRVQAVKEQQQAVQEEVKQLFEGIDQNAATIVGGTTPGKQSLLSPLEGGKVVKRFGKTVHDKFRTVVLHKGLEIEAAHRSPVHAVGEGKVEFEGWITGLGNVVVVQHPNGYFSLSAHLFETAVKAGQDVTQGQLIGSVGDTGTSAKPSLYFELRHKGKAIDPLTRFDIGPVKISQAPAAPESEKM